MAVEIKAEYNSTQQELYSITETICDNASVPAILAALVAYKAKYTPAFITAIRDAVTAAKLLPSEEERNEAFQEKRVELIPLAQTCRDLFIDLKGYIIDAWPEAQHENKFEAAGQANFSAGEENWEEVVGLNTAMKNFITNNDAQLTTPGGMPATFTTVVTDASDNFDVTYGEFKVARQTAVGTAEKVGANNAINARVNALCADAQKVFKNDAERKKLFTFSVVKDLISPKGSASFKLTVKATGTNLPVADATVTIQTAGGTPLVLRTDVNGVVVYEDIDPATYNCKVEGTGFPTLNFVKDVNTGVQARKEVTVG